LWSDSIKMIPRFAIVGCGPEGFRKAFPVYKSEQLAQLSPRANNESPHNAYLETAISYGLPGAAVYVLMIAYALALMLRARRHARSQSWRIIATGLLASFLAVLSHNIFIFDQISTGLYFFALLAVAFVLSEIAGQSASQDQAGQRIQTTPAAAGRQAERGSNTRPRWQEIAITAPACALVVAAAWFSISLLKVEMAYTKLFNPSRPPDYQAILLQEERITNNPLPTGAYDFLYARALNLFAQQISNPASSAARSAARGSDLGAIRTEALRLAISHTEKSLAHTNTPDWNYSFLASLALATADTEKLRWAAAEAVKWDPSNYYARWLMAEAYIACGEREQAKREAEAALKLYPPSPEAASALARATGQISGDDVAGIMARARNTRLNVKRSAEDLIEIARRLSEAGKMQKARTKLFVAIGRAGGRCANCHRELAVVYERMGRYSDAITEWGSFSQESPDTASAEQAKARIAELQAKMAKP
jgi:tetratricopeptide (TPR) repeat protein